MFFIVLITVAALAQKLVAHRFFPAHAGSPTALRFGMCVGLLFAGIDHLVSVERYIPMVPSMLAEPALIVYFTGLCEIAGGIGLMLRQTRRLAGIMLAIYFVCVFPANVKNAVEGLAVEGLPQDQWYYWFRLLLQPIVIWWALAAAEVIRLPALLRSNRAG